MTQNPPFVARLLRRFTHTQDGAITSFGIFLVIAMICVGGLGLDVANAIMVRTHLQVAADSAAHAALVAREYRTEAESKAIAITIASQSLPPSKFGTTIEAGDITFGTWDAATQVFTASPGSDDAVLVNTQRLAGRGNSVGTFFLRFIGMNHLDVISQSVFETYYPTCFLEGFVAQDVVDIQSNNTYDDGFCIHSNTHVEVNNGNTFLDGVIVSMPNRGDLVIPSSGPGANPGLQDALRSGAYRLRVLNRIDDIIANVEDPSSDYFRTAYVDIDPLTGDPEVVTFSKNDRIQDIWVEGAIHKATCNAANQTITLSANQSVHKGVIVTNCQVSLGANSLITDVIIVTENTNTDSIKGGSGAQIGLDDGCSPGGGAQLVTLGGFTSAANLAIYGGQIIAAKTIDFESRADGIEGVSMVAGEEIDGTSLMNMGFCGGLGMENNFMAEYFRLAT